MHSEKMGGAPPLTFLSFVKAQKAKMAVAAKADRNNFYERNMRKMTDTNFSKAASRFLALFLAIVMLLSFAACGKDEDDLVDTDEETENEESTEDDGIVSNVPAALTFNNQEVRLWIANSEATKNEVGWTNEPVGIIQQAIVERNYNAEDRLGIVLTFVDQGAGTGDKQVEPTRNIILTGGGADGMDLVTGSAYYSSTLASEGLLYNLKSDANENYINVTAPWYNKTFVEQCSFRDSLYWSVGDFNLTAYDRSPVTFINEDAMLSWSIEEDLYQVALDGEWTMEKLQTLIKDVHEELDNAEGQTKGDFYGLFFNSGAMCVDALIVASGIRITTKTDDGLHELTWAQGKANEAFAKIYELMYDTSGVYLGTTTKEGGTYYGDICDYYSEEAFYEQRCIFSFGILKAAQTFATDTTLHYGMLPMPKYSKDQAYATTPHDGYTLVGIPSNISDRLAIASATLEILSEFAYRTVRPVYFETAYKIRYASSENTALLFDTVIESITFDFGTLYSSSLGDPVHQLRGRLVGSGGVAPSNSLSTVTRAFSTAMRLQIDKLITKFDEMKMAE